MTAKLWLSLLLIASIHVGFLFSAYGSHFFGLPLPYLVVILLWIFVSSSVALRFYYLTLSKSTIFVDSEYRNIKLVSFSVGLVMLSLYLGVFAAFNTFGT